MSGLRTMLHQLVVVIVIFWCVWSTARASLRRCRNDNFEPCKFRLTNRSSGAISREENQCSCLDSRRCLADWSSSSRIAEYNLKVYCHPMQLQMMFCERVDNLRICNPSEYYLQLSKPNQSSVAVDSYTCRCQQSHYDLAAKFNYGGRRRYEYMCGQMPVCTANQVWLSLVEGREAIHCRCYYPMVGEALSATKIYPRCLSRQ